MAGWLGAEGARRNTFVRNGVGGVQIFIAVLLTVLATSSAQPGFLSIDCGGTLGNFTDSINMTWVADNAFIKTGKSLQMTTASNSSLGFNRVLKTLRYFPQGRDKYCYELPTTPNASYLVRATFFMSSAVWNARRPVQFGVSIDATNWFSFTSNEPVDDDSYLLANQEGVFHTSNDLINFCLQPGIGEAFISSLELRQLDPTMYSYGGSELQYLSLLFRYNIGAPYSPSSVRYPDDRYDRLWSTIDNGNGLLPFVNRSSPPETTTQADVFFVPPKVMKDAWLLSYPLNWVSASLYPNDPQIFLPQGDYAYPILYAEHLNASDSEVYTVGISLDGFDPTPMNFTNRVTMLAHPNFILSSNYFSLTMNLSTGVTLEDGPTMNACEVYSQASFNFSSTSTPDDKAVTAVKSSFNLTDWQGDPCTPVPHDWLECSLDSATFQPIVQLCNSDQSSVRECVIQEGFLRSTYYVVSLKLSNLPSSGFQLLTNSTDVVLSSLTNLSITSSGVDSTTFEYFLTSFSNATRLFLLDFSNNAIDVAPDWSVMDSLITLNLAHNNLTDLSSSFEDARLPDTLTELNLSYNAITSLPPDWQMSYNSLNVLDLSYNQIQADISSLEQLVQVNGGALQELDVSHNQYFGTFSGSAFFYQLSNLTNADFSENSIQGTLNLTDWYNSLKRASTQNMNLDVDTTTQVKARMFSFVNNNITDILPTAKEFESVVNILKTQQGAVLLGGNPYCDGATSYTQRYLCRFTVNDDVEVRKKSKRWVLIISICSGIIIFLLLCAIFAMLWRLWKQVRSLRTVQRALADRKVQPPFYQYNDLRVATSDFNKDQKLGHGSFGVVYKGVLADGTMLAVKKIFNSQTLQVLDDFLNEVVIITGIKHRNLVQLKGCCIRDKQRMLVYEYAERGNLAEALWGSKAHGGLDWEQRFDICVGVARGLAYLHEELYPSIIHRDIKPANILLDKNFKPKIADFGLALYHSEEPSDFDSTEIAGTMGYLAPEYAMHGYLSDKVDVYSYGVVILEVVCGRKSIDSTLPPDEKFLKDWVCNQIRNDTVLDILQPEIKCSCVLSEVMCAIKIGLLCIQHRPELRPSMSQVVTMLSGHKDLESFMVKSSSDQSSIQDLVGFIRSDDNYPTMRRLAEDSTIYPLASLDSQAASSVTSWGQSTQTSIELSSITKK